MPRLPHSLLHQASRSSTFLPLLLQTCRDLKSAQNELRWLRDHFTPRVDSVWISRSSPATVNSRSLALKRAVSQRARGKPLQYILGTQPFGPLNLEVNKDVLIPRQCTEDYTTFLAHLLIKKSDSWRREPLRIVDLCTGSGCIPLLLHSTLSPYFASLKITGIDNSIAALHLARRNKSLHITNGILSPRAQSEVSFEEQDVLSATAMPSENVDVVISNPPYISALSLWKNTSRSVRLFEPRSALVPPSFENQGKAPLSRSAPRTEVDQLCKGAEGDLFYPYVLQYAWASSAKLALVEVGDLNQAKRVVGAIMDLGKAGTAPSGENRSQAWEGIQLWCDDPKELSEETAAPKVVVQGRSIDVIGAGEVRAVVCWRGDTPLAYRRA